MPELPDITVYLEALERRVLQQTLTRIRIENIFVITKLSLVFDVYPTEEQAIASFAERESV